MQRWVPLFIFFVQALVLLFFEKVVGSSLVFMSAYGAGENTGWQNSVVMIPAALAVGWVLPPRYRPVFYFISAFLLMKSLWMSAPLLLTAFLVYGVSGYATHLTLLSAFLYLWTGTLVGISGYLWAQEPRNVFSWVWLMIHVSWGLKLIAWITSVRVYKYRFTFLNFLDYFFNPVFFFFTNDLNVLTPRRFALSEGRVPMKSSQIKNIFVFLISGLLLMFCYGLLQRHYFMELARWGSAAHPVIGGVISVVTAVVFHASNVLIQVSFLRAQGYDIAVDMNKPWLATSPMDYWKRMHFYVREYIFEIIVRPILTSLLRSTQSLQRVRILIVILLYLLFTSTQLGYQPFRQNRQWQVGLLVTGIFMAMIIVPELLKNHFGMKAVFTHKYVGRILTFLILILGYALIFSFRAGF